MVIDPGGFVALPAPLGAPQPPALIRPTEASPPLERPERLRARLIRDGGDYFITDLGDYLVPGP